MEKPKITQRQLLAVAFVCQLSPIIRLLPIASVKYAGRAAWLSVIAAAVPCTLYTVFLCRFVNKRKEGESLSDLIIRCTGSAVGKIICFVFLVWIVFYSGFILRSASERLLSTIFENGNMSAISFIMLIAVLSTLYGSIKALAGMGEIMCLLIGAALAILLLLGAGDIKIEYLLPITPGDIPGILRGVVPAFDISTIIVYVAFLSGYAKKKDNEISTGIRWGGYSLLAMFGITVTTVGMFSALFLVKLQNPFFSMIRNISVFGVVERMEAVVVGMWVFTDFLYLTVLMNVGMAIFESIFGKARKYCTGIGWGALTFFASFIISKTSFNTVNLSLKAVPIVNLIFTAGILPLVCAVGKIRKTL